MDVTCGTAQPLCALSSDFTTALTRLKQPYDVATEYVPVTTSVPRQPLKYLTDFHTQTYEQPPNIVTSKLIWRTREDLG